MKLIQAEAQKFEHGRLGDLVHESHLVWYESRQAPIDMHFSVESKRDSTVPWAPRDNNRECRTRSLVALFWSALLQNAHGEILLFTVRKSGFSKKRFGLAGRVNTTKSLC